MKEKPTPLFWFFDKDCVRGDRWRDDIAISGGTAMLTGL